MNLDEHSWSSLTIAYGPLHSVAELAVAVAASWPWLMVVEARCGKQSNQLVDRHRTHLEHTGVECFMSVMSRLLVYPRRFQSLSVYYRADDVLADGLNRRTVQPTR